METELRDLDKQLASYLAHGSAHASFGEAVANFPMAKINTRLPGLPYSAWELIEHIRIVQHDMVDFIENSDYEPLEWPHDYWPKPGLKGTGKLWQASISAYKVDLKQLIKIINNPHYNILAKIPRGEGQTILQEVLQIIDHTSYHTGALILMRRAMGEWNLNQ